jgi:CRP-like cAMP-binding protein/anti-anti-sigma regulatory factor
MGAAMLFTLSNVRPIVRRVMDGSACRSCTARDIAAVRRLDAEGERIVLMELQGSLFFGTAEQLAERVQQLPAQVRFLILDLHWLRQVDNSGAQMLADISAMLARRGCRLYLCSMKGEVQERWSRRLADSNCRLFADRDQAMSAAEDALLGSAGVSPRPDLKLQDTVLARGLSPRETAFLQAYLSEGALQEAGYLFRLGDAGACLMVASNRSVEILLPVDDGRRRRIASVAPGVAFGEMAVLDAQPRSADAWVDGPVHYWALSRAGLEALGAAHPSIAFRLLANLGLELSARLRATTRELRIANQQDD